MFDELKIICIIVFNQSHKSLKMIKRNNKTFRTIMNKMTFSNENFIDTLKKIASTCNERYMKHLNYISNQIFHNIEFRDLTIVRSIKTTMLFDKIIFFIVEKMLSYV